MRNVQSQTVLCLDNIIINKHTSSHPWKAHCKKGPTAAAVADGLGAKALTPGLEG